MTPEIPIVPQVTPPVDPVQRSIAKHDAFTKPASFKGKGKGEAATKSTKPTRIRTMDWKKTRGRPRKTLRDVRDVQFFIVFILLSLNVALT